MEKHGHMWYTLHNQLMKDFLQKEEKRREYSNADMRPDGHGSAFVFLFKAEKSRTLHRICIS
jgi:hypothetical protein